MPADCDVSIVMISYNQTRILPIVLDCLGAQDYRGSWELIVSDDGSQEDTLNVIRQAPSSVVGRVRYIWQPRDRARRAAARNNGLRCAKGRVVIFLDGDIAVRKDFISEHVALHSGDMKIVYGTRFGLFLSDLPGGRMRLPIVELLLSPTKDKVSMQTDLRSQEHFAASSCPWLACLGFSFSFVRHSAPVFFDEEFVGWGCEDQEFVCRLAVRHGYKLNFSRAIDTIHVEGGSRRDYLRVPLRASSQIASYTRNVVRFCDLYPDFDHALIARPLGYFEYNAEDSKWKRAKRPKFDKDHILALLDAARGTVAEDSVEF